MFWKKKSPSSVPWRDKNGEIVCPGDNCPQDCELHCPIWANTCGLEHLMQENYKAAISCFNTAIKLAPDFADAHNNLGSAYGQAGQITDAYSAFQKALSIKNDYPLALRGLILCEKSLGKTADAAKHTKMYKSMYGEDPFPSQEKVEQPQSSNDAKQQLQVLMELLEMGRTAGYIRSQGFTHIPEIVEQAHNVCYKILVNLAKHEENEGVDASTALIIMLAWAAYAGMGAVYHWHTDWDSLSRFGIYETLVAERGLDEMDEYVLDQIGFPFGSPKERGLTRFLQSLAAQCLTHVGNTTDKSAMDYLSLMKSMYFFGMIFEMNQLGML